MAMAGWQGWGLCTMDTYRAIAPGAVGNRTSTASSSRADRSRPVLAGIGDRRGGSGRGGNRLRAVRGSSAEDAWMCDPARGEDVGGSRRSREAGRSGAEYGCAVPLAKAAVGFPERDSLPQPTREGYPP